MAAIVEEGNCGTGATCSPRLGLFFDSKKPYICAFVFCVYDGLGWDGMGWDGTGQDGAGRDGGADFA